MRLQFAALIVTCLVGGALFAACSNQAEGQHCDPRFGNEDCADGLVCKRATELGGVYDLCCPATGANVVECRRSVIQDGGDSPAPDATTPVTDAATQDATVDTGASTDAGSDTATDASIDAPADAPIDASDSGDQ